MQYMKWNVDGKMKINDLVKSNKGSPTYLPIKSDTGERN